MLCMLVWELDQRFTKSADAKLPAPHSQVIQPQNSLQSIAVPRSVAQQHIQV